MHGKVTFVSLLLLVGSSAVVGFRSGVRRVNTPVLLLHHVGLLYLGGRVGELGLWLVVLSSCRLLLLLLFFALGG